MDARMDDGRTWTIMTLKTDTGARGWDKQVRKISENRFLG